MQIFGEGGGGGGADANFREIFFIKIGNEAAVFEHFDEVMIVE